ncbi:MAG: replication-associated recombination protein A [Acidiferrobacterales bacterium]|nr:replication-associated recombination protein A [Acidiferrobacterales bacterium]
MGNQPLAERMRPASAEEVVGQGHLVDANQPLRRVLDGGHLHSMILWGPPGSGKTTIARLLAKNGNATLQTISAVTSGVQDIRKAIKSATELKKAGGQVLLFVDEVHRFNKAQQDAFLPHIENGVIIFVGATTENPSFELNNALLSRSRVYLLQAISSEAIAKLIERALLDTARGLGDLQITIAEDAKSFLAEAAQGDARRALGFLETAADIAAGEETDQVITLELMRQVVTDRTVQFDKGGDHFYDQISALHKSIRGSDPDAAAYWLNRMLQGGCDPHYVLRRLVRIASEDVGNADPRAITLTLDAWNSFDRLGSPEGDLAITQAAIYLAVCAKSNAVYRAHKLVNQAIHEFPDQPVPLHIRNAPTGLAKSMGHGAGYRYAHDEENTFSAGQTYFPDAMGEPVFYSPSENGLEKKIGEKLDWLRSKHHSEKGKT